jgi:acetyl esterase/lipase
MSPRPGPRTVKYGPLPEQEGDLWLPERAHPPVVCLLHGGFWRMPYGRDQLDGVARDLAGRGFAAWNLEYRRLGAAGSGWPGTFDDVALGIDRLAGLVADGVGLDLERVAVCGHSAGGHLALWSAARGRGSAQPGARGGVRIAAVVGQAPLADLERCDALRLGGTAVRELLGGAPEEVPERYRAASPRALLPLGVPQLLLHGGADGAVPVEISREYCRAARAAGDEVELVELPGLGHMDFLDPASAAHAALRSFLEVRLDGL